eukprot:ANDGO_08603.mRNA.1 permease
MSAEFLKRLLMGLPTGVGMGVFSSLTGVGGAIVGQSLMTMKWLGNMSLPIAVGTSVAAVTATCAGGAYAYFTEMSKSSDAKYTFDVPATAVLASTSILTSGLGLMVGKHLKGPKQSLFTGLFILSTPLVIYLPEIIQIVRPSMIAESAIADAAVADRPTYADLTSLLREDFSLDFTSSFVRNFVGGLGDGAVWPVWYAAAAGAVAGFLSGAIGVGGGLMMTAVLSVHERASQKQAVGSSLAAMLPTALIGSVVHFRRGNVALGMLPGIFAGTVVGSAVGSKFAVNRLSDYEQKAIFGGTMLLLGARTILRK